MLPRIRAFAPDLLLISAGFDGADGDDGNAQEPSPNPGPSPSPNPRVTLILALQHGQGRPGASRAGQP